MKLTLFSVSDPNKARLLSFQSYFLAFRKPAMFADTDAAGCDSGKKEHDELLFGGAQVGVRSTVECNRLYSRESVRMRNRRGRCIRMGIPLSFVARIQSFVCASLSSMLWWSVDGKSYLYSVNGF